MRQNCQFDVKKDASNVNGVTPGYPSEKVHVNVYELKKR